MLQSPLPTSTVTFALGILALVVVAVHMGFQTRRSLVNAASQRADLDDAAAATEELAILLLRLEDGRASATTISGAMRARLERSRDNPALARSAAARRLAADLSKSTINVSDMLQTIAQLHADLHHQQSTLQADVEQLSANAARDLWVISGLLVVMSLIFVAATWGHSRQLAQLATTARNIRAGDLAARADADAGGEVAELANDFNEMVEILVESLALEEQHVAELQQRATELEAANRHKSRFLANVSHEFKTPLSAVIGFTEVLKSDLHGPLTDKQRDYLARIGDAGHHLKTMIADLIDAARIDLATLQLSPAVLDPDATAREAADMLETTAQEKAVILTVAAAAADATITCRHDPARLRQILINLLSNAVKFTPPEGRVTLTVEAATDAVTFTVDDDGPGIPAADRERIFQDFVQLDDTLDRRHEGTGMGLAISRRLAHLMGGTLTCSDSPSHHGARFILQLPGKQPVDDT